MIQILVGMEIKKKYMKDPQNCPICEAELLGHSRPWGLSPEGWIAITERHNREHKDSK